MKVPQNENFKWLEIVPLYSKSYCHLFWLWKLKEVHYHKSKFELKSHHRYFCLTPWSNKCFTTMNTLPVFCPVFPAALRADLDLSSFLINFYSRHGCGGFGLWGLGLQKFNNLCQFLVHTNHLISYLKNEEWQADRKGYNRYNYNYPGFYCHFTLLDLADTSVLSSAYL